MKLEVGNCYLDYYQNVFKIILNIKELSKHPNYISRTYPFLGIDIMVGTIRVFNEQGKTNLPEYTYLIKEYLKD